MRFIEHVTIDALKALVLYKALHVMCLRKSSHHCLVYNCCTFYFIIYVTETRSTQRETTYNSIILVTKTSNCYLNVLYSV